MIIAHKKSARRTRGNSSGRRKPTLEEAETRLRGRSTIGPGSVFFTWPRAAQPTTRFPAATAILSNGSRRGVSDLGRERGGRSATVGKRETRCTTLSSDIDLSVSAFDATWKKEVGRGLLTFVGTTPQVRTRFVRHLLSSKSLRENPPSLVDLEIRSISCRSK